MKKWLPIFLIAILLVKPALADENEATDETTRETEDKTTDFETPDSNTNTNPDNRDQETREPENTNPGPEIKNPEYGYEQYVPYEEPYEVPYEEPLMEDPEVEGPEIEEQYEEPETPIVETPTDTPVQINILETESYAVFGKVLVDGEEKSDIEVTLKGEKEQKVKTAKDGTFSFKELAPGAYEVLPTYKESNEKIKPIEITILDRDKIDIIFDIKSEVKKTENKEEATAVKNIEREEEAGIPLYLKWIIVIGSLLIPVSVILYFVFRKV